MYLSFLISLPYRYHIGLPYDINKVLNSDATFNEEAYKSYSPLFLSYVLSMIYVGSYLMFRCEWLRTTFAISYGLSFASISATIVHTVLYLRKSIRVHLSRSLAEQPDVHAQLMTRYQQGM